MRKIKWWLLVPLLLVVLAAVLLWQAPAALAYRYLADRLGPIRLLDVGGSLWNGRARQFVVHDVALGTLHWTLSPWSLLVRRPAGELVLGGAEVEARTHFEVDGRMLTMRALDARFPAPLLAPALDIPALRLSGTVKVQARQARIVDGLLASAEGKAEWREIAASGAAQGRLPGIRVDFEPAADAGVVARITDLGGPVAINGTTRLRDGRFVSETTFELREPNAQLAQVLAYVGQRTPTGGSYLRIEGELHRLTGSSR